MNFSNEYLLNHLLHGSAQYVWAVYGICVYNINVWVQC